jgi:hypothetical protein
MPCTYRSYIYVTSYFLWNNKQLCTELFALNDGDIILFFHFKETYFLFKGMLKTRESSLELIKCLNHIDDYI